MSIENTPEQAIQDIVFSVLHREYGYNADVDVRSPTIWQHAVQQHPTITFGQEKATMHLEEMNGAYVARIIFDLLQGDATQEVTVMCPLQGANVHSSPCSLQEAAGALQTFYSEDRAERKELIQEQINNAREFGQFRP